VKAGNVTVHSNANATQDANSGGFAGSAFAAAGVMIAETVAGHSSKAEANGKITATQLDVTADATRAGDADANFQGIALFTGEVGFEAEKTSGDTEATIGEDANITITNGGGVNVTATSNDTADTDIVDAAIGAFTIGAQASSSLIESNTRARVAGRVNARNATVAATGNKKADATTDILNLNILSLNGVGLSKIADALPKDLPIPVLPPFDTVATASISGATEASLGGKADVTTVTGSRSPPTATTKRSPTT
jgi:hypothetical protein